MDEIDQNTHDVATYRIWRKAVSLILLVTGILIFSELTLPYINEPFIHHHDFNSAYWSLVARNFAENGVFRSGFAMVVNTGPLFEDTELLIDIRHPPLYPLILSTGIRIFGDRELSTRIVKWFLSIVLIIVIYFTLKNLFSPWASAITALLTLFTPAFVYFSVVCDFEYLNLIFIFLSIWAYVSWFREPARKGKLVLSLLFCFLSSQVDWQGYELAVLAVHAFIYRSDIRSRGGNWKLALLYFPTCLISLLFYLVFVITVYSGGIDMLLQRFLVRSGLESYSMFSFELLLGYFHRVYRNFKYMFTRSYVYTFILFFCYLAWLALSQPEKRGDFSISMALILFGIVHFVLFSDATLVHD